MRIVFLTQYFPPEVGAPQARLSELAAHFLKRGHEVTVLTAMPNYPTGKIMEGYGGFLKRENVDGNNIIRTFIYPTKRANFLHRLTNYFSFVLSSAIMGSITLRRPNFILVESPPLFLGFSAIWLNKLKRARLIFNVSDLWPESAVRMGLLRDNSMAYRMSAWLEALCYRKAWLVSGQSKSIIENISERFPQVKTFHLSNGADTHKFSPACKSSAGRSVLGDDKQFVVLYAGLHGLAQGLEQIVDAANTLQKEGRYRFVLVGDGPEKNRLVDRARQLGLENISFLDSRPSQEIPPLVASADVIVVPLKHYIPGAVPSKIYEAMASGRPVILIASGEAAEIIQNSNAGLVVEPGDIAGLVEALRSLHNDADSTLQYGANGRKAALDNFDRSLIANRFIDYLEANL